MNQSLIINEKENFGWHFESVPGYFLQDNESTDDSTFDFIDSNFGVGENSWKTTIENFKSLVVNNEDSSVFYKMLFLARHGQGWHNFAADKYGEAEWDRKWALLNGDGEITWGPDPELTELGVKQAQICNSAWKEQLKRGAPLPQRWYCSPFTRALDTMIHTWGDITLNKISDDISDGDKTRPTIVDTLHEMTGIHTCDKRRTKSYVQEAYPKFIIDPDLTEEDLSWTPDYRETEMEVAKRASKFLVALFRLELEKRSSDDGDDVSSQDPVDIEDLFISVTCHSGVINGFLAALGHRPFEIQTGGLIPVIVKGHKAH